MAVRVNKSASRALDILALLAARKQFLTLKEIGSALNLPKSSTFEIVYTMVERKFLEETENKRFNLGLKVFEVGNAYIAQLDVVRIAAPYLDGLAKRVDDTIFLAVENNSQVVYIHKIRGGSNVVQTCELGSRNHMHCTGLGKALLAGYPDAKVEGILGETPLSRPAMNTITSKAALFKDLNEIRRRGYAIDDRENWDDSYCIAAPIFSVGREPLAAISVATFFHKVDEKLRSLLIREVTRTALAISRRMGFSGDRLYGDSSPGEAQPDGSWTADVPPAPG
ncbi:MAG: IclR family transcriptional regulator [Planctomycetota bacterium]|jgi:DNA-binding IclR family transcriptional regulator|nr:IclR family transcriptional regulator [Planctomycetota bacterium]